MPTDDPLRPYDAVVLLSFGGPESPDEVMPFLHRVTAGRGVPEERLLAVAEHYYRRDGVSPLNGQNRALATALEGALQDAGAPRPVQLGNRNSRPFLADTLRELYAAGARRVVTVLTSAYSSYSSCRQYRENLAAAVGELADEGLAVQVDKVGPYVTHPAFVHATVDRVLAALDEASPQAYLLAVTHSIPDAMDEMSGPGDGEGRLYTDQHHRLLAAVVDAAALRLGREVPAELVYCSRSGPPHIPWLEPDISARLEQLAAAGVRDVVIAPIGFVSDHMEVVNDLDDEALSTAQRLGMTARRVPTVGTDPGFVGGLVDLLLARAAEARGEVATVASALPGDVRPSVCAAGCCPNLRAAAPALCGED